MATTWHASHTTPAATPAAKTTDISAVTAGYGVAAAVTVLFNTVFAWIKDANPGLEHAMKSLLGHHWTTHGVVDVAVFLILGFVLSHNSLTRRVDGARLTQLLIGSSVLGGVGLAAWFFLV